MTVQDQFMLALTVWRENRGGQPQPQAMQSVMNVILNRAKRDNSSAYFQCVRRLQFSSITAPGDPELTLWPTEKDPQWAVAQQLVNSALSGTLEDLTGGAVDYYNPSSIQTNQTITLPTGETIPFPKGWNQSKVVFQTKIAGHYFFREV